MPWMQIGVVVLMATVANAAEWRKIGEGATARVSTNGRIVKKEVKPQFLHKVKDLRKSFALLRQDEMLAAAIPATRVLADGTIYQKMVHGLPLLQLNFESRVAANKNMWQLIERANARGTPNGIDTALHNFRFDREGNVTGWFDPLLLW